jgi:chromosome segregation ATPase
MDKHNYTFNIPKLLKDNQDLNNRVRELTAVNDTLIKLLKHKDKRIEELHREYAELCVRIEYLKKELDNTNEELATIKSEFVTIKTQFAIIKETLAKCNTFISKFYN